MGLSDERPVKTGMRGVLLTGLGVVLALLVVMGVYAAGSLLSVSRAGTLTTRDYLEQSQRLETVHRVLSAASGAVRDYLLDSNPTAVEKHRDSARQSWQKAMQAINEYKRVAALSRRRLIDQLDSQVSDYWRVAELSIEVTGKRRLSEGVSLQMTQLVPLREKYLSTISEIGAADGADLRAGAANTARFARGVEKRLWSAIGVTVLLSLLVAGATVRYLVRLENMALTQYQASVKTGAELERLYRRMLTLQEDERRGIARELHDDYGQRIASLLFELAAAAERTDVTPELRTFLQEMGGRLGEIAKDVQQLSRSLHSAVLERIGLEAAIRSECNSLRQRTPWEIEYLSADVPKRLPESLSVAVYRVFQEATQNALKHSEPNRLEVSLTVETRELVLRVRDQGGGFDPQMAEQAGSLGLVSMRERMRMVGGAAVVRPGLGKGTCVEARVPIPAG